MTSKKGAIEDTKKNINIARRGPEKEVFKFSRSSKIEVNHCYQIELKALSDTRV